MSFLELFFSNGQPDEVTLLPTTEFLVAVVDKAVQLVDIRTQGEYKYEHIKGAVNIDWLRPSRFKKAVSSLDKKEPIYIYCRTGSRSNEAAKKLVALGFAKVYNLDGGITSVK